MGYQMLSVVFNCRCSKRQDENSQGRNRKDSDDCQHHVGHFLPPISLILRRSPEDYRPPVRGSLAGALGRGAVVAAGGGWRDIN